MTCLRFEACSLLPFSEGEGDYVTSLDQSDRGISAAESGVKSSALQS